MNILHIATEFAPIVKVGGLADVLYGLCNSLSQKKHIRISVLLPLYDCIRTHDIFHTLRKHICFLLYTSLNSYEVIVWKTTFQKITIYFLAIPFHFQKIYCNEEIQQFLIFSLAAVQFIHLDIYLNKNIIIHIHDWPTAFIAPLIKYSNTHSSTTILTLHNLQYQGICSIKELLELGWNKYFFIPEYILQNNGQINLLQGGLYSADAITTVSPTYALEITQKKHPLHKVIQSRKDSIQGILNGIDYEFWNPEIDTLIYRNYSNMSIHSIRYGKRKNRDFLAHTIQLQKTQSPLFIAITRLVSHKGPDLLLHAIKYVQSLGGQFILLSDFIEKKFQKKFTELQFQTKDHPDISLCLFFEESFAHLLYAAADFIIIPSHIEPCGLTQMISSRYGTIAIARKTGGLSDSLEHGKTGILFPDINYKSLEKAIDVAFLLYEKQTKIFENMMYNAATKNFSWSIGAAKYEKLYENVYNKRSV